jgi:hypothetical protein
VKRRYKQGDWFRVPLGGEHDALGVIARACRSRLFGYFFAIPASHEPSHDELRALAPENAIAALLFGGGPIEEARWRIVAASLTFDPNAWPFPAFASRGAFGDAWIQVRYDPETLQILERRSIDAADAKALADARFANAEEAERVLQQAIAGEPAPHAQSILELRSPIDAGRLRAVAHGGRVQFSTPLRARDIEQLARFIDAHPHVALRVHGFRHGFDAAHLTRFGGLRELVLDVHALQHPNALQSLHSLQTLRIGAVKTHLDFLGSLTRLRTLELHGTRAPLDPVADLAALHTLVLEGTASIDPAGLRCAPELQALVLAHGEYDVRGLHRLSNLRRLELRALDLSELPAFSELPKLEELELQHLTRIADLRPVADARMLRSLRIGKMPQLNVADFRPLQRCAGLRELFVDVGSRTKEREIYRLMKLGNTHVL